MPTPGNTQPHISRELNMAFINLLGIKDAYFQKFDAAQPATNLSRVTLDDIGFLVESSLGRFIPADRPIYPTVSEFWISMDPDDRNTLFEIVLSHEAQPFGLRTKISLDEKAIINGLNAEPMKLTVSSLFSEKHDDGFIDPEAVSGEVEHTLTLADLQAFSGLIQLLSDRSKPQSS